MQLSQLAHGFKVVGPDVEVKGITYNSKKVKPGDLFVALKGRNTDGHLFIEEALKNGAVALMVQEDRDYPAPYIYVENTRKYLGIISAKFYGNPSQRLKTIGITGTNGKTTTTFMIRDMLEAQGEKTGLLGTILYCIGENCVEAGRTTPESSDIQDFMHKALKEGAKYFVMEVSSAGIEEYRIEGTHFHVGCFTNFSREHMEYHGTMENYLKAKLKLFEVYKPEHSVINADDPYASYFLKASKKPLTFGINENASLKAEIVNCSLNGSYVNLYGLINEKDIFIPLPGVFNVYNFLCAASVLYILNKAQNLKELALNIKPVPGRLQRVDNKCGIYVFIDYAHTPEAMRNLLENVKQYKKGKIITVFGAGGDRDPGKRPLFGKIAEELSDIQIVTSDNPRSEPPEKIIEDILKGMKSNKAKVIPDRREAIYNAIKLAERGDIILIIGKGHENYQEIKGVKYPFSDYEVASEALKEKGCLQ
ncbi:MAG: UDP-N-acetylmuramoyl-L-alanyl-D-glutamate--2,6-diaminopimelate ligase [bacterium]|nr:UDP-N-acetylmuramoyl-L-alanyl-D-glutamate--2,6-diaminopimelate ligase [bacterium]